ncbi:MAG: sensor histidine kinase, partial [Calditrichaeota bacterium]
MDLQNGDLRYLEKRVAHLEEVNRRIQASLETIKTLTYFQRKISNKNDLTLIFQESTNRLRQLVNFKVVGFFLYDADAGEFVPKFVSPQFLFDDVKMEVDCQIEAGTFAWALNQNSPVIIKPQLLEQEFEVVLKSLSTENRVLGMFVGQLFEPRESIYHEAFDLLAIALTTTSLAVENATLYHEIEAHNQSLKKKIAKQTDELRRKNEELVALNAKKDKFFSIISHDLRSPFSTLVGSAEFLLDEIDTLDKSEIRECVRDMHSSASNLLNLLDNLLTWSLIHGEGVAFQPTRFDLSEVISHVLDVFRSSAEKKAITLECRGEQPLEVTADRNMLNSVLQNLVSNAVKFTDSGGRVVVEARKSDHGFELTVT